MANETASANAAGDWIEIAVEVAGIDSEVAADLLRQACPGGVAIEAASKLDRTIDAYVVDGDAPALVKGYLAADSGWQRLRDSLKLALQMAPLQRAPAWRRARRLREASWRDAWKKHFGLQRIGRSLLIVPSWVDYTPKGGETVIRIDPGMAFGTGQHPTTAMCLRALEELMRPGCAVLDLGCGSGILAIAAAKLGAARVLALDNDPQAVKAATENAAANDAAGVIEVREGTLGVDSGQWTVDRGFDLVAANISGLTLQRLAGAIHAALAPGGRLVASGFLEDATEGVTRALEAAGLRVERTVEEGIWRAIIARKAA